MMRSAFNKIVALGPRSFLILTEIWLKLLLARASFACLPESFATRIWFVSQSVAKQEKPLSDAIKKQAKVDLIVKLLQIAVSHHWVTLTCLHRVLVLKNMMDKNGIPSAIVIGVKKNDDTLAAHAWLEVTGNVVADDEVYTRGFKPLMVKEEAQRVLLGLQKTC